MMQHDRSNALQTFVSRDRSPADRSLNASPLAGSAMAERNSELRVSDAGSRSPKVRAAYQPLKNRDHKYFAPKPLDLGPTKKFGFITHMDFSPTKKKLEPINLSPVKRVARKHHRGISDLKMANQRMNLLYGSG